jgi:hypothetical protein
MQYYPSLEYQYHGFLESISWFTMIKPNIKNAEI